MTSRHVAAWLCVALSGMGASAQAQIEPSAWLARAAKAAEQTNFTGTVILNRHGEMRTMRIYHGFDGERAHQRMVALSGEECEILRRADEASVVFPKRRLVVHGHQNERDPLPKISNDVESLERHYELEIEGRERVAGRECVKVLATPRDMYRYGYALCLDARSDLPLRVQLVTPNGERYDHFAFTTLMVLESIQEFRPDTFNIETDTQGFSRMGISYGALPTVPQWRVQELPPGFEQQSSVMRIPPRGGDPVQHMVLADPLSRISVFIEPLPDPTHDLSFKRWAYHGYQMVRHGHQITVVGGVPAKTAQMIGNSLDPQP